MEILIVGIFVVALMVYVSTKIKKSAAQAFEPENIDTENFVITKPEGFIIPVNEESEYAFEAYSKDYGDDEARSIKQVSAVVKVLPNSNFKAICKDAEKAFDKFPSKKNLADAAEDQKNCLLEGERTKDKISYQVYQKIVESSDLKKILDLKISVLRENREQYQDQISELLSSFTVK